MERNKQKIILIKAGWMLLVLSVIYICIRYVLLFLLPFLLGFFIAWLLRPTAAYLKRHSGFGNRGASIVAAIVFYAVLAGILWLTGIGVAIGIRRARECLPQMIEEHFLPMISEAGRRWGSWQQHWGQQEEAQQVVEAFEGVADNMLSGLSGFLVRWMGAAAQGIPAFVLALLFTIISSVLICGDYERVTSFVMNQIPVRIHGPLLELRNFMAGTLWKLVKAYLILMVITFALLAIGLGILKIKGFWMVSAIVAMLDLLPIIGSGLVLLPWSIGLMLMGDTYTGVGILVVWAILSVARQVLEPRIIGDQIGLHPLVTLTAMYVGLKLAGFTGLLAAPVICLLLQHMQQKGYIKLFYSQED